tara:strand:- start:164 stop:382 length:219 start_codon:yes stop_codon:yes gene_type:complete
MLVAEVVQSMEIVAQLVLEVLVAEALEEVHLQVHHLQVLLVLQEQQILAVVVVVLTNLIQVEQVVQVSLLQV